MIQRYNTTDAIRTAIDRSRIVALLGPRQCGKTTLARQFVSPDSPNYSKTSRNGRSSPPRFFSGTAGFSTSS